jgi:hypothetical protein
MTDTIAIAITCVVLGLPTLWLIYKGRIKKLSVGNVHLGGVDLLAVVIHLDGLRASLHRTEKQINLLQKKHADGMYFRFKDAVKINDETKLELFWMYVHYFLSQMADENHILDCIADDGKPEQHFLLGKIALIKLKFEAMKNVGTEWKDIEKFITAMVAEVIRKFAHIARNEWQKWEIEAERVKAILKQYPDVSEKYPEIEFTISNMRKSL